MKSCAKLPPGKESLKRSGLFESDLPAQPNHANVPASASSFSCRWPGGNFLRAAIPARNAGQYAPPEKAGQSHKSCNCAATLVVAEPFWEPACAEADINTPLPV